MRQLNRYLYLLLFLGMSLLSFSPLSQGAKQAVAVDYLQGSDDIKGLRFAYRPYVTQIDVTQISPVRWLGKLDLYWEVSANVWEYGDPNQYESNLALAMSPVFSREFATLKGGYTLRWEFGIGFTLVDDTRFAGKDIGTNFQFEDRLGVILTMGAQQQHHLALRYMHYSNGGLNDDNPGLDFLSASYAWHF